MNVVRAAVCAAVLSTFVPGTAPAQSLQPFQQRALDKMLESVEPELRPILRAQLAPTLAALNEQQVTMMLEAMAEGADASGSGSDSAYDAPAESAATAEDLAYNRAQFEPMIRKAWAAGKSFDELVTAKLAESCPPDGRFAVFGAAWRYEVYPLSPTWPRVSNSAELDVEIIGASYAPQDGRYDFDFSAVRLDFDEAAVERAIANACVEYTAIGQAFIAAARADAAGNEVPPNGDRIMRDFNAQAGAVRSRLEALLQAQAPGGNNALFTALLNGRPVR